MATADEVRDALLERIAYHAISASADEVLSLAKAYSLLADEPDDDDDSKTTSSFPAIVTDDREGCRRCRTAVRRSRAF